LSLFGCHLFPIPFWGASSPLYTCPLYQVPDIYYLFIEIPQTKQLAKESKERFEYGPYCKREVFPILGDRQFTQTVERILQELKDHAPRRYREAVGFLPTAFQFDPVNFDYWELYRRNGTVHGYVSKPFAGRSDGDFALSGYEDYYYFRHVFLHEVGHCVRGRQNDDWSEDAAEGYAAMVERELER
jgi:hypothetical protein